MKEQAVRTQKAKATPATVGTLTIGGIEYVVVPRVDYLKHAGTLPRGSVEAHTHIRASIADGLRAARERAGLTQGQLAEKLGKSQTLVSLSEAGRERIGEKYVAAVLKACGLPKDWKPSKTARGRA
jgi:ribosome-binding protein aMBF1 (putative translation factor)